MINKFILKDFCYDLELYFKAKLLRLIEFTDFTFLIHFIKKNSMNNKY